MKKENVGMVKRFTKKYGNKSRFQITAIGKLCQDACQCPMQLLQTDFSVCTEVITTSLILLETILPEEYVFII